MLNSLQQLKHSDVNRAKYKKLRNLLNLEWKYTMHEDNGIAN